MIITPAECPSCGLDKESPTIEIKPMGYQDLLAYSRELHAATSPVGRFFVDFSWFKKSIPAWKSINLIDLDWLIFKWKLASVSDESEFVIKLKCPECGKEQELMLDVSRISDPVKPDYYLGGTIKLGNPERSYEFKCGNAEFFDNVLDKCYRSGRVKDIDTIKLISMFPEFGNNPNQIERLIINATLDDIRVLETLKLMYLDTHVKLKYRCEFCKGGTWSMRVSSLIDNPFLGLVQSQKSIKSKITVEPIRRD